MEKQLTITITFQDEELLEDNSIERYNLEQLQSMYRPHQNKYKNAILTDTYARLNSILAKIDSHKEKQKKTNRNKVKNVLSSARN